jgi:hypothetical protein
MRKLLTLAAFAGLLLGMNAPASATTYVGFFIVPMSNPDAEPSAGPFDSDYHCEQYLFAHSFVGYECIKRRYHAN